MKTLAFARNALGSCAIAVMLGACGAGQHPLGASGAMAQSSAIEGVARHNGSWMLPDAKKKELLYVSDFYGSDVLVFTYPRGKPVGTLTGIYEAQGECTSATSNGNWWVVATGASQVLEYAHGGTAPIATINVTAGQPASCAVDPSTGDLAVTILSADEVVVYANGSGSGTTYMTPISPFFCGYDDRGNLFVDGSGPVSLAELPKGASSFESITLNQAILFAGAVQWHGKYLAIGDQETSDIYRFKIRGTAGTLAGTTPLDGGGAGGFWIKNHDVIAPNAGEVAVWKYPAGGSPIKTISGGFEDPIDVTVSEPPTSRD